jgi:hypothetical protein
MWIPVSDDRDIDVVGGVAAGEHGVQLLPGLSTGHHAMRGVGGDPLSGVHGGGVTQFGSRGERSRLAGWRCGRSVCAARATHRFEPG